MVQPASAEVATWITVPRWRGNSITAGSPLSNARATFARRARGELELVELPGPRPGQARLDLVRSAVELVDDRVPVVRAD